MPSGLTEWDYNKIKTISFIDEIIHETLRLRPAVMTGGYRVTPAQGIQVDGVHIPGDVNVFVPVQLIQTDEGYYKQPKEFIPERWGERKQELQVENAPFLPFSLGELNHMIERIHGLTRYVLQARMTALEKIWLGLVFESRFDSDSEI